MQAEKNKPTYRMNIGGASIILILLVFSMTIFAILSIRASYNELKLARNSKSYVEQYYEADTRAEEVLALICDAAAEKMTLQDIKQLIITEERVEDVNLIERGINFSVMLNENAKLYIELIINGTEVKKNIWKMTVSELDGYENDSFEIWESDWFE